MSKADKPVKLTVTSQLKKDLNHAGKVIQNLANSIEKLENGFSDAETALTNEGSLKENLSLAQREITRLQEAHDKLRNETQGKIASYADANLELVREYDVRVSKLVVEHESKLKESQRREEALELRWKQKVEIEKLETQRSKETESRGRTEIQNQLRKVKENLERKEEEFKSILRQRDGDIVELSARNKALTTELNEHETMLKGRDTEMNRVRSRLAALEAFPSQEVTEKLTDVIAKLQNTLREFCVSCVDSAEVLPGWSHEAIWRLMTVDSILGDQQMVDKYKADLREVAKSLLSSWSPFPGETQKTETFDKLIRLLIDSATISLELQKVQRRIHVSAEVVSQYFDSDSEEDSHNVPGGYELPDSTVPVLCLFPAFFWTTSLGVTPQKNLLRKGTAMFRDSPPLLAALNEERGVRSPNMSSRRRPTN